MFCIENCHTALSLIVGKNGWKGVKAISLKAFGLRLFTWIWNSSLSWPQSNHWYLRELWCVSTDISKIYDGISVNGSKRNSFFTAAAMCEKLFYKKSQLAYDKTFCLTFQHVIWHSIWSAHSKTTSSFTYRLCAKITPFSQKQTFSFSAEKSHLSANGSAVVGRDEYC